MNKFEKAFEKIIMLEGGYSNHPSDTGGETQYGITKSTARNFGYTGNMKDLTKEIAKEIYKKNYWDKNRLNEIYCPELQLEIFDSGVNCGTTTAIKFVQRAYNILNKTHQIKVDGIIGKNTITALNGYNKPNRLVKLANAYQAKYYLEITEKRKANKDFIFGWLDKRVEI